MVILVHSHHYRLAYRTVLYHLGNLFVRCVVAQYVAYQNFAVRVPADKAHKFLTVFAVCGNGLFAHNVLFVHYALSQQFKV